MFFYVFAFSTIQGEMFAAEDQWSLSWKAVDEWLAISNCPENKHFMGEIYIYVVSLMIGNASLIFRL